MTRALRFCFVFALLAVPAFAQTAATRATLYTEIDTLFADTGSDPITPAQLRQSLKNITASSYNGLTDGVVSSTYLPLAGGTLTGGLVLPSTNTDGVKLYNTADQSTNYERLEILYSGSVAYIRNAIGGTGTMRALHLASGARNIVIKQSAVPFVEFGTGSTGGVGNYYQFTTTNTATTGPNAIVAIKPTYNQASGTAANTDLLIDRTETAVGSGAQNLADFQVGGTSKFKVSNAGAVTTAGAINKVTLTAPATGSTLTIADGKTLTASNTLTLTATDGSTLAVGAGGTLGTAAYTAASAYATSAQGTKADNVGAVNGIVKSNGSASFSAASAGTDYVVPAGNVATATALATARTIGNVSFDGTANIVPETSAVVDSTDASSYPLMVDSATGSLQPKTDAGLTYNATTGVLTATGFAGPLTGNVTGDVSGSSGSTTGNAATATALATPRAIYGNNFDGSAALTQIIASTYGGTGNGFAKFSGPTTSEKTFTLPDANATLLYAGGDAGTPSALVGTNISGTAASLTAGTVTTNANLSGHVTSVGNTASLGSFTVAQLNTAISDADVATGGGTATGTNTGDQTTITGNAGTATALQTARTIGGSSFDGTGNVTSFPEPGAIGGTTPSSGQFTTLNASGLLSAATQALIGGSTGYVNSAARPIYIVPVATAATGAAQAIFIVPELVATANSDQIYGTEIKSKLTTAGFTGLTTVNLYLNGQTLGGGGTLATAYQLYIAAGPTATARWGVYQAGSSDQNYFAAPIDVGNADTTLARASAGTLSVEGVNIATETYAQTAAKATKLGSHASPDTTGGAITWATSAVYEVWTNTTTEYDLPAASGYDGKAVIFYVTGTNAITIDPNSSEVIVRDGTAQTGGVTLTLTGAAGNYVCLICDGTRWVTLGYKGTLAAGS